MVEGSENWRGVPITEIYGAQSPWGAPEFPLVLPSYNHTVLYHIPSHGDQHNERPPKPQIGHDKWDHEYVRMPCSSQSLYNVEENGVKKSKKRWLIIEESLSKPIANSEELALAILSYNVKFKTVWKFKALHKLFNEYLEEEETQYFFNVTLPAIAKLALDLPKVIQTAIPLLKQHKNRSISLSQQQIASLLANAFFCTFPRRNSTKQSSEYASYPYINFNALYECHGSDSVLEKLKCLCHYFRRVTTKVPLGVVSFCRRSVPPSALPAWEGCGRGAGRAPLHVCARGTIEDHGLGLIQLDFANKYLGGGVLGRGCVQEEIRFVICPELIISMLFTEVLGPTEALLVIGSERYSEYSGYGDSFRWAGDHGDGTPLDSSRRRRVAVLALDATPYRRAALQYTRAHLLRELNKAWVGMSFFAAESGCALQLPGVATGNWGCGAFGGCPRVKALLQVMVAAYIRRPLAYFTFRDVELRNDIINMYNLLATYNVTIGELFGYITKFSESEAKGSELYAFIHQSLIDRDSNNAAVKMDISSTETEDVKKETSGSPDLFSEEFNSSFTEDNKDSNSFRQKTQNQQSVTENKHEIKIEIPPDNVHDNPYRSDFDHLPTSKMDEVNSISSSPDPFSQNLERESKSLNQTTRLFEEMQRIDDESGSLNLKKPHEKVLALTDSTAQDQNDLSPLNKSFVNEDGFLASDTPIDVKKKIGKKITDYFSKKT